MNEEFMNLSVDQRVKKFFSGFQTVVYRRGEVILRPEDDPGGVAYIKTGYVRMYKISIDGKELTLNIFKPGSYFPMIWAISNIKNTYFFEAMTETTALRAPKDAVVDFLKRDAKILFELTNRLVIGFSGLLTNIENLLSSNANQRVASTLLIMANRFGKKVRTNQVAIKLPLTHEDLSRLTGLTRETTSIQMKKLMDSKLIDYGRKKLVVLDIKKLRSVVGGKFP